MTHISRRSGVSAFAIGITLVLPGIIAAPAGASTTRRSTHHRGPARPQKPSRHVATVLSVSDSTPAPPNVSRQPASGVGAPAVPAKCANTALVPSASNLAAVDAATLCLIDKARRASGLAPLAANVELDQAAVLHSDDMVTEDYFDHVSPVGTTPGQRILATGYRPRAPGGEVAENIGAATLSDATPAATVAAWMGSPGHRQNILNPDFTQTGIGATNAVPGLLGAGPGGTYTEDFA
jgi:uncharacterized protein YkwD